MTQPHKLGSSDCIWSSKSLKILEAKRHAFYLSLWLRSSHCMSGERDSFWMSADSLALSWICLHPFYLTLPWDAGSRSLILTWFLSPSTAFLCLSWFPQPKGTALRLCRLPTAFTSSPSSQAGMGERGIFSALGTAYELILWAEP